MHSRKKRKLNNSYQFMLDTMQVNALNMLADFGITDNINKHFLLSFPPQNQIIISDALTKLVKYNLLNDDTRHLIKLAHDHCVTEICDLYIRFNSVGYLNDKLYYALCLACNNTFKKYEPLKTYKAIYNAMLKILNASFSSKMTAEDKTFLHVLTLAIPNNISELIKFISSLNKHKLFTNSILKAIFEMGFMFADEQLTQHQFLSLLNININEKTKAEELLQSINEIKLNPALTLHANDLTTSTENEAPTIDEIQISSDEEVEHPNRRCFIM